MFSITKASLGGYILGVKCLVWGKWRVFNLHLISAWIGFIIKRIFYASEMKRYEKEKQKTNYKFNNCNIYWFL